MRVLLNNQATDRLTGDVLKLAWPFGLGSWPKVDHDADDGDRVPEGAQKDLEPRAECDRPRSRERPSSNVSDFYSAQRQPPWLSQQAARLGVRRQIRSKS